MDDNPRIVKGPALSFVRGWTVGERYAVRATLRPDPNDADLLNLHCEWAPEVPGDDLEDLSDAERIEHLGKLTAAIESITDEVKGDNGGGTKH